MKKDTDFKLCELLSQRFDKDDILKHILDCFNNRSYDYDQFITYRLKVNGIKAGFIDLYILKDGFVLVSMIKE